MYVQWLNTQRNYIHFQIHMLLKLAWLCCCCLYIIATSSSAKRKSIRVYIAIVVVRYSEIKKRTKKVAKAAATRSTHIFCSSRASPCLTEIATRGYSSRYRITRLLLLLLSLSEYACVFLILHAFAAHWLAASHILAGFATADTLWCRKRAISLN